MPATRILVASLTVLSVLLLAVMVPGGPVETRHFANVGALAVIGFNVFLTALAFASLATVYLVLTRRRGAAVAAVAAGMGFAAVYLLDLLRIFPVSTDPIPSLLWTLEVAGLLVSVPLIGSAVKLRHMTRQDGATAARASLTPRVRQALGLAGLVGLGIVVFASYHALKA